MTWARKDYTDVLVVVGDNLQDAKHFLREVQRQRPDLLLGYAIKLVTLQSHWRRDLEGLRIYDRLISFQARRHPDIEEVEAVLCRSILFTRPPRSA